MLLGVLGGNFDPPHLGHLLAASDAFEQLELDRVLFVPAGTQPFKAHSTVATAEQRFRMVELTISADPRFSAERVEVDRAGLSYSVDTLADFAARWPGAQVHFLIGEDLASQVASWREPERIAALATIVVLGRDAPLVSETTSVHVPIRRLPTRRIDLSSTEIRDRVRAGKSIHGFVTDAVAEYIAAAELYR